jgi:uncharacterized membrane protein (GlpM family)
MKCLIMYFVYINVIYFFKYSLRYFISDAFKPHFLPPRWQIKSLNHIKQFILWADI